MICTMTTWTKAGLLHEPCIKFISDPAGYFFSVVWIRILGSLGHMDPEKSGSGKRKLIGVKKVRNIGYICTFLGFGSVAQGPMAVK